MQLLDNGGEKMADGTLAFNSFIQNLHIFVAFPFHSLKNVIVSGWVEGNPTVYLEEEASCGLMTLISSPRPPQHLYSAKILGCMLKTPKERLKPFRKKAAEKCHTSGWSYYLTKIISKEILIGAG